MCERCSVLAERRGEQKYKRKRGGVQAFAEYTRVPGCSRFALQFATSTSKASRPARLAITNDRTMLVWLVIRTRVPTIDTSVHTRVVNSAQIRAGPSKTREKNVFTGTVTHIRWLAAEKIWESPGDFSVGERIRRGILRREVKEKKEHVFLSPQGDLLLLFLAVKAEFVLWGCFRYCFM